MTFNKSTILLIIFGYYITYKNDAYLGSYISLTILSAVILLGMLFTYLIKEAENIKNQQVQ